MCIVCSDTPKANEHAKRVKAIAQKVLDEASDVLDDKTVRVHEYMHCSDSILLGPHVQAEGRP